MRIHRSTERKPKQKLNRNTFSPRTKKNEIQLIGFTSTDGRLFDVTFAMVNPRIDSLCALMVHTNNSVYFPSHSLHNLIVRLQWHHNNVKINRRAFKITENASEIARIWVKYLPEFTWCHHIPPTSARDNACPRFRDCDLWLCRCPYRLPLCLIHEKE